MDPFEKKLYELVKEHRGELVGHKKHRKYRFPNGKMWTIPGAGNHTSARSWQNNYSDLYNILVPPDPTRGQAGERREKKIKREKVVTRATLGTEVLKDNTGLLDSLLHVVRFTRPKWGVCYPIDRRTCLRTPMSVFMSRIFGGNK